MKESWIRRAWPAWVVICVLLFLVGAFFVSGGPSRIAARSQARQAYMNSRVGAPGSYEFISRGLKYGMTPDEVRRVMDSADEKSYQLRQYTPPWEGSVDCYIFRYRPLWRGPFRTKARALYEEWFWVYYDEAGQAVKVRCDTLHDNDHDQVVVDLKAKEVHEGS